MPNPARADSAHFLKNVKERHDTHGHSCCQAPSPDERIHSMDWYRWGLSRRAYTSNANMRETRLRDYGFLLTAHCSVGGAVLLRDSMAVVSCALYHFSMYTNERLRLHPSLRRCAPQWRWYVLRRCTGATCTVEDASVVAGKRQLDVYRVSTFLRVGEPTVRVKTVTLHREFNGG